MEKESKNKIPQHEIDSLARLLLPAIQRLFEQEGIDDEYQAWLLEYKKEPKSITNDN